VWKKFNSFVKKIPTDIHSNTKSIISTNIAIFIPEQFVFDKTLHVEEYQFIVMFNTPPRATVNGDEYQFKKGSLICLAPGDDMLVHSFNTSLPVNYMSICIDNSYLLKLYSELSGKDKLEFKKVDITFSRQLLDAVEALMYEILNYEYKSPLMIESLENRIAIQLIRDAKQKVSMLDNNLKSPQNIVQKALKYIESYYSSNITIKDICNEVYVSSSYLQKIFLKYTGMTPYQYIMECRHQNAKEMLETTSVSVNEVARYCGFVNNAHFSTTFKQREGLSPLEYKKVNQASK